MIIIEFIIILNSMSYSGFDPREPAIKKLSKFPRYHEL